MLTSLSLSTWVLAWRLSSLLSSLGSFLVLISNQTAWKKLTKFGNVDSCMPPWCWGSRTGWWGWSILPAGSSEISLTSSPQPHLAVKAARTLCLKYFSSGHSHSQDIWNRRWNWCCSLCTPSASACWCSRGLACYIWAGGGQKFITCLLTSFTFKKEHF